MSNIGELGIDLSTTTKYKYNFDVIAFFKLNGIDHQAVISKFEYIELNMLSDEQLEEVKKKLVDMVFPKGKKVPIKNGGEVEKVEFKLINCEIINVQKGTK